jgi:hypothetical protein
MEPAKSNTGRSMIENGFPVNEQRKKDLKSSNSLDNGMVSPPLEDYAIPGSYM